MDLDSGGGGVREARAPVADRHGPDRRPARGSARSQSRGRSKPSELLARKQQLLAAGDSMLHQSANEPTLMVSNNGHQEPTTPSSVELKLESLSELLMSHQQQSMDNNFGPQSPASAAKTQANCSIEDVYILLAKKEKDLQLAAELGKVLLEKNDELSKANERITEDYSQKLEDKHRLKRKLDLLDSEYENRLIELQADCNILKNQLDEQQQVARQTEKEKSKLIDDLVQQNQRLTSELVEATKSEELLSSQLEQMNERFNGHLSNRQDHAVQLDTLKEEIQIVNQRKLDLERRLRVAQTDKANLNAALDESGDKILLLEKLLNEKESRLGDLMAELEELRDSSSWLSNELESMLSLNERLAATGSGGGGGGDGPEVAGQALLAPNELYSASQRKRSQLIEQLRELRLRHRSRLRAREFRLTNGQELMESREASSASGAGSKANRKREALRRKSRRVLQAAKQRADNYSSLYDELESSNRSSSQDEGAAVEGEEEDCEEEEDEAMVGREDEQLLSRGELVAEIYSMLQRFHQSLALRKDELLHHQNQSSQTTTTSTSSTNFYSAPNSADDSGISADDVLDHKAVADQASWRRLLAALRSLIEEMPCSTCRLMIAERADFEQLQKVHARLADEARRKDDQLLALSVAKTEQETRLANLEERCRLLSDDLSNCDKPKEEIVKLAWKARDEAVERKNAAEISLAKTRIENMQISSQLMEVVQQKGELSQKLAQFEDDIHYITQHSVKAKFTWEEYAEKLRRSKQQQSASANQWRRRRQDSQASSNPLAQLLSFSVASSVRNNAGTGSSSSTNDNNNSQQQQQRQEHDKSSAMDNHVGQPASLMRNLTSNRFNLRFWQRSSTEKVQDKSGALISGAAAAAATNDTNETTGSVEQKVA